MSDRSQSISHPELHTLRGLILRDTLTSMSQVVTAGLLGNAIDERQDEGSMETHEDEVTRDGVSAFRTIVRGGFTVYHKRLFFYSQVVAFLYISCCGFLVYSKCFFPVYSKAVCRMW